MKKTLPLLLFVIAFASPGLIAQTPYVKQILTSNSGKFEFAPPYADYVTIQSNYPVTGEGAVIHSVGTQSSQDMCKKGNIAYIAAQDSLIMMNLDNYQRVGAIADTGLSRIFIYNNFLIITKQYPVTSGFVEVRNAADLSLVSTIGGITGDCSGITAFRDSVYVAFNGGWMGTEGKIAIISTKNWSLSGIFNLGMPAVGILSMYQYKGKIFSVNKSPYSQPGTGSISVYDPMTGVYTNLVYDKNVAGGAGIEGNYLYFIYNYGIASLNMNTLQLENPEIISDPGSSMFRYITSATVDTLNHKIYANVGDYISPGYCLITSLNGDSLSTWATGISSDALLVDYRVSGLGIGHSENIKTRIVVYPNSVSGTFRILTSKNAGIRNVTITELTGRSVKSFYPAFKDSETYEAGDIPPGMYLVRVSFSDGQIISEKFIKD